MVVSDSKDVRQARIVNEEKSKDVIAYVTINLRTSFRLIAMESGISQTSVIRILNNYKFHPYHMFFHQNLYGNDFANRINSCNWICRQFDLNPLFTYYLMFSDEALFTKTGQVNRHNIISLI